MPRHQRRSRAQEAAWFKQAGVEPRSRYGAAGADQRPCRGTDRRARFVGIEAYEAAGGISCATCSPKRTMATHRSCVARPARGGPAGTGSRDHPSRRVEVDRDYTRRRLCRIAWFPPRLPASAPLDVDQQAELDRLTVAYDALAEEHGDDAPSPCAPKCRRSPTRSTHYPSGRVAGAPRTSPAPVRLSVSPCRQLSVERGLVHPEDVAEAAETATPRGSTV